jgi:hypothetical protein
MIFETLYLSPVLKSQASLSTTIVSIVVIVAIIGGLGTGLVVVPTFTGVRGSMGL